MGLFYKFHKNKKSEKEEIFERIYNDQTNPKH